MSDRSLFTSILESRGLVAPAALDAALANQRALARGGHPRDLGAVLVAMGHLGADVLEDVRRGAGGVRVRCERCGQEAVPPRIATDGWPSCDACGGRCVLAAPAAGDPAAATLAVPERRRVEPPPIAAAFTRPPGAGDEIGGCRIVRKLGQGGMGAVYEARHLMLDKAVALKLLDPALAASPQVVERFQREARAAAKLDHPNIVRVLNVGSDRGLHFIVQQFVAGESLNDVLVREGRLDPRRATGVVREIARGLAAAHAQGIVHRDVKPANVLMTPQGEVKVADFGLAKEMASDVELSQTGQVLGSPHYLSPEQGAGRPVDHRTDLYALGVTFFYCLAGQRPFEAATPIALIFKHINEPAPRLTDVAPDVPEPYAAVVARCLNKNPAQRYPDCAALIADLEHLLRHSGKAAAPARPRADLPGEVTVQAPRGRAPARAPSPEEETWPEDKPATAPSGVTTIDELEVVDETGTARTRGTRETAPKRPRVLGRLVLLLLLLAVAGGAVYWAVEPEGATRIWLHARAKVEGWVHRPESSGRSPGSGATEPAPVTAPASAPAPAPAPVPVSVPTPAPTPAPAPAPGPDPREAEAEAARVAAEAAEAARVAAAAEAARLAAEQARADARAGWEQKFATLEAQVAAAPEAFAANLAALADFETTCPERDLAELAASLKAQHAAARATAAEHAARDALAAADGAQAAGDLLAALRHCGEFPAAFADAPAARRVHERHAAIAAAIAAAIEQPRAALPDDAEALGAARREADANVERYAGSRFATAALAVQHDVTRLADTQAQAWAGIAGPLEQSDPAAALLRWRHVALVAGPALAGRARSRVTAIQDAAALDGVRARLRANDPAGAEAAAAAVLADAARAGAHPAARTLRDHAATLRTGMVYVPAVALRRDDGQHDVPAFYIDRFEVTAARFLQFVAAGGYEDDALWAGAGGDTGLDAAARRAQCVDRSGQPGPRYWANGKPPAGLEDHPVRGVDWFEARAYARWLGQDLPTEAQWEIAAGVDVAGRAFRDYPWGDAWDATKAYAGVSESAPPTVPVDTYPQGASALGCRHMAGNVREWTLGWFEGRHERVVRGGGAYLLDPAAETRVRARHGKAPHLAGDDVGFRCVKPAPSLAALGLE